MINYRQLNPFKKAFYSLKARSKIFIDKLRFAKVINAASIKD